MQKPKESLFLSPKFKKIYIIVVCSLWITSFLIFSMLSLFGSDFVSTNDNVYSYSTALFLVLVVMGMLVDESIRKYPGIIVSVVTAIQSFCYISICILKGGYSIAGIIMQICFALYIIIAFLIYKYIYQMLVVKKNAVKIFNTLYLMLIVLITVGIGSFYWISKL